VVGVSLAERLVKLVSRFLFGGAGSDHLAHVLHDVRQRLHLVGECSDVEEEGSAPE